MTLTKVKRSQVKTFLNTGSIVSPVWVLIGDGVKSAKVDYKPKVTDETYISDDAATITVDSYAPTMPVPMAAKVGDAAFAYVDALRKGRSVLGDAETEIVNVWLYKPTAGGYYPAERQAVSIQVDDFGGDGGVAAVLDYTLNYIGDPVLGIFKPAATATFEATPVTTILTTMVIGSVTLTPLFSADHSHLLYTGSVANGTTGVTMTSTLAGSTIVQKVATDVVSQAGTAALSVGVNHLTIEVTVGAAVSTYRIDITRAAA